MTDTKQEQLYLSLLAKTNVEELLSETTGLGWSTASLCALYDALHSTAEDSTLLAFEVLQALAGGFRLNFSGTLNTLEQTPVLADAYMWQFLQALFDVLYDSQEDEDEEFLYDNLD